MGGATVMRFSDDNTVIPKWILYHLRKYGNCCCGREIVKKLGREKILQLLRKDGYPCILRIVYDDMFHKPRRKVKYPRDAYYILEIECVVKSYFI